MPDFSSAKLQTILAERMYPTVTLWNRLESRPRAEEFGRALRAEVRDALWMLTRQWQMGELEGDDAGSPALATLRARTTPLTDYRGLDGSERGIAETRPLECEVEERKVPLLQQGLPMSLDLRLALGRRWLRMIAAIGDYAEVFRLAYPFKTLDPANEAHAPQTAHPELVALLLAIEGRAMDGGLLYLHLKGPPAGQAADDVAIAPGDVSQINDKGDEFVTWFEQLIAQPDGAGESWSPSRLEHEFELGARSGSADTTLHAGQYGGGRLDWYEFDVDPRAAVPGASSGSAVPESAPIESATIPAQVAYEGMPLARWWAFEDSKVNLADVKPGPTNIGTLLLLDFLLVYSNDWRISPLTVPVNCLVEVEGLVVDNVFGERTWIEPAGRGDDEDRQRWSMFGLSSRGSVHEPADQRLLVLDTCASPLRSEPVEQVALIRDEIANMVWGIEKAIQSAAGNRKQGDEAGRELREALSRLGPPPPPEAPRLAAARYRLESTVPEHWIPFVPVRIDGQSRAVQLQRAVSRRILNDTDRGMVRPRTSLLREGLDRDPQEPYFLFEEEVPRAGAIVEVRYERARGRDGRVYVWLAGAKGVGRGGGSSGLAYDLLEEAKVDEQS